MRRILVLSVLLWLLMFTASPVSAATWTVPSQKFSIPEALSVASAGDDIRFSADYTEHGMVTVNKSVTIHNPGEYDVKVIAQGNDPYAVKVTATGVLIDGLTLQGGKDACLDILGTGGGTVSNCTLSPGNQTDYGAMLYGTDAILEECIVEDGTNACAQLLGGAIVRQCTMTASGNPAVGLWWGDVEDCGMTKTGAGAAILAETEAEGTISGCVITAQSGTGISLHGGILSVTGNTIQVTSEAETNTGILSEGGSPENDDEVVISDCFISVPNGIGIDVETAWNEVTQCTIDDTKWGVIDMEGGVVRNSIATNCYVGFTTTSSNKAAYCIGWPEGYGFGPNSKGTTSVEEDPLYCGASQYTLRVDSYGNPGNNDSEELIGAFPVACMFGTLTRDTEYLGDGTLYVPGDVVTPSGKTLTLGPGTTVKARDGDSLSTGDDTWKVEVTVSSGGTLTVSGTEGNPVAFTSVNASPEEGDWEGIHVNSGGTAYIDHADVGYADYGVSYLSTTAGHVSNSTFAGNAVADIAAGASNTMSATIDDNLITVGGGKGILLVSYSRGLTIEGNSFVGDEYESYAAIQFGSFSTGEYPLISGNDIQSVANGYGIYAKDASPTIVMNTLDYCGYGIYTSGGAAVVGVQDDWDSRNSFPLCYQGMKVEGGTPVVRSNDFTGNRGWGVLVKYSGNPDLGTAQHAGNNNLSGSWYYCIENLNTSVTVSARGNYFGQCPATCYAGSVDAGDCLAYPPSGKDVAMRTLPDQVTKPVVHEVYPNPIRSMGRIAFSLPEASAEVHVQIFDVAGRVIRDFGKLAADRGRQEVSWDGRDDRGVPVGTGIYFVRVVVDNRQAGAVKALVAR